MPILGTMNGKTILIIEDDRSLARLMEIVFDGKGLKAHPCLDSNRAIEMARRLRPDLIILDIHMPRRSGVGVLKKLRQDDATRQTPVIVFSVLSRRQSIEQLKKMGAVDFVSKGAGMDALMEKAMLYLGS